MPPDPIDAIAAALSALPQQALCVGFSGGIDSSVLLHALATMPAARAQGLRAWHVHHGLHAHADDWAEHCRAICEGLEVPLRISHVSVSRAGEGLEAAARKARRDAFARDLGGDEVLTLAHHLDDQAETFLLRALRASGPDGLAAMQPWRRFARGWLWRPLLGIPRDALLAYAQRHGLHWIDDPGNADTGFDRNFLRHRVMPLLRERWPQAGAAWARSAALCGEGADLLAAEDAAALASARGDDPRVLGVDVLSGLPAARRARVLRRWIEELGLPPLPAAGSARIESDLLVARADADAAFAWSGAVIRRWRGLLHADLVRGPLPAEFEVAWDGREPLRLPTGDVLWLEKNTVGAASAANKPAAASHLAFAAEAAPTNNRSLAFDPPLRVHERRGGERIQLAGRTHSHALKKLLQEREVPPWQRERLPLLSSADGELLAAGDVVCSGAFDDWLRAHDARLLWTQPL
ncbi:tRNA lysidine(34) synthetase TilS [Lysobacter sp. D1-1-M9]|uniref:tRNA lysidine(34) synthetase TilS n=2 Tax=Novilysobacter TaxID=3382699 RepID=UPI002FCB7397